MPELPEVETTVRALRKKLVGLKFKDVWTDWPKTFKVAGLRLAEAGYGHAKAGGFGNFKKEIKNKKILDIKRRAKFIVIDIEGKYSIFIHQKISGHLLYGHWVPEIPNPKNQIPNKFQIPKNLETIKKWVAADKGPLMDDSENRFIRTIFFLSNGYQLAFSDLRRFGKIVLVKDDDLSELPEIKNLGPEPLEIGLKEFKGLFYNGLTIINGQTIHRKKGRIKQVLMDPFFIAGIGNIYADEILWDSGYHPLSRAEDLSDGDLKKIFKSTVKILKKAIKLGGSSVEDYRMPSGDKGKYQDQTKAYQRDGEKCFKKDGGIIMRIKLGGRSAHFCLVHQKLR